MVQSSYSEQVVLVFYSKKPLKANSFIGNTVLHNLEIEINLTINIICKQLCDNIDTAHRQIML